MEKRTPHCPLATIVKLVRAGNVRYTASALMGAQDLGLDVAEMIAVVLALSPKDFYKSMTTYADDRVWQDVYRTITKAGEVYLKLTVVHDVLIVSFKKR